jgi:kynurenine formamidase
LTTRHVSKALPSESEAIDWIERYSNWGRWGEEDQVGAVNLITPEKLAAAAALVRDGITVGCGRRIQYAPNAGLPEALTPPLHFMGRSGEVASDDGIDAAHDWAGLPLHGFYITHLDAFSHMFWKGKMYNGRSSRLVTTDKGARAGSVEPVARAIVSRGVLLDIPRLRGVEWLEDGDWVSQEEIEAAEKATGVRVEPGDVCIVRTGYGARRPSDGLNLPGLSADCIPWLNERTPALLTSDTTNDAGASRYKRLSSPIHVACLVKLGIWLVDKCDLEELARTCARLNRWEFLFSIAPLRLANATGCPVNPTAIF